MYNQQWPIIVTVKLSNIKNISCAQNRKKKFIEF